jgi:hypothetical protein
MPRELAASPISRDLDQVGRRSGLPGVGCRRGARPSLDQRQNLVRVSCNRPEPENGHAMPERSEAERPTAAKELSPVRWRSAFAEVLTTSRRKDRRMPSWLLVAMAVITCTVAVFASLL